MGEGEGGKEKTGKRVAKLGLRFTLSVNHCALMCCAVMCCDVLCDVM